MKTPTTCKRCGAQDVSWHQGIRGNWQLRDRSGDDHRCLDEKIKAVKCKYCDANDLHWAEDINPTTRIKKMVLTESYGLPHACDARLAFLAKEKQDKKDKYEAEKKRVTSHPDGRCPLCLGFAYCGIGIGGNCKNCYGYLTFTEHTRKSMLAVVRRKIWPNMGDSFNNRRR